MQTKWDKEVDLLVIGAGAGGMGTALVAALEGLQVLVCERSDQVGGTAATSAGTVWIPGNTQSIAAGYNDSASQAKAYMDGLIASDHGNTLRDAFLASGPGVIDYLERRSEVKFVPSGRHPDYMDREGAAVTGRALAPATFDARVLKGDFRRVRPPIPEFMVFGGMMVGKDDIPRLINRFKSVGNFWYAGKLFARYLVDRLSHARGTRLVMGNALVARLFYSLRKANVPVAFNAGLQDLIVHSRQVQGAKVRIDGKETFIRARKGVVLATGGYAHNQELRAAFMPKPTPANSLACATNQGDGVAIGRKLGARIEPDRHGPGAFWTPVSKTTRANGESGLYPHLSMDRAKPGLIAVNSAGKRFVNEGNSYHDFVNAMLESHKTVPTIPAYLICEADFVRKYGLGAIHPGVRNLDPYKRSGYLSCANTLAELAALIGVDPVGLAETVHRHNGFAKTGIDADFSKGSTELNRFNGDASNRPNPCLAPIERGPFCAMAVWPAEIGCSTGLAADVDGRVLHDDGTPIDGLYVCGNDMASIMSGTYPGPGTTLGPALVFGYRVAMHAKQRMLAAT
ncbi:MAG: FAD-dependent oxidoreductase [Pseudomonadota bacterium]